MAISNVKLILGDQLNARHSWFAEPSDDTVFIIAELQQETQYVKHHIQKLCGFFLAMENFAHALREAGHNVVHLTLDESQAFSSLPHLIEHYCTQYNAKTFHYQRPDEHRLLIQLRDFAIEGVDVCLWDTEHFLLPFEEIAKQFKANKAHRMEAFYRRMRKRFNILMVGDEPKGGKWNYDAENRQSLNEQELASIPEPLTFKHDVSAILERLEKHDVPYFGELGNPQAFIWPVTRKQGRELLSYFCEYLLPNFGQFQDAMTSQSPHQWSLYHSRISFALNTKMLNPLEVINTALSAYEDNIDINLAQIEGFIRQILGWREFVRAMYWANMPEYQDSNYLQAERPLPEYFWSGKTHMKCMQACLGQSLEYAYAHHIQRLMVIGNFSLLAGLDPKYVDEWYLGVYIDAIEWVEMPNTRGMSQFADGGLVASKPYVASANYIKKMSDYCDACRYKATQKTGQNACPFNSLYWHFLHRHQDLFKRNPRMALTYKNWQKQSEQNKQLILQQAQHYLDNIESL
ncbi:cryptochrome/photolyase family protein [Bermanella sp. R86510]|uniref:cryptochrome/photolyase family protein n=1 Tax=unclassified Bermanella TaxID=2627862 RepID=UPI0037C591F8